MQREEGNWISPELSRTEQHEEIAPSTRLSELGRRPLAKRDASSSPRGPIRVNAPRGQSARAASVGDREADRTAGDPLPSEDSFGTESDAAGPLHELTASPSGEVSDGCSPNTDQIAPKVYQGSGERASPHRAIQSIIAANTSREIYVPFLLARIVWLFLMKNYSRRRRRNAPLFLTLVGPPGVGKSCILREICRRTGVKFYEIDASTCYETPVVAAGVEEMERIYENAAQQQEEGTPSAIIADDIHLGLGVRDNASYTKNLDVAQSRLMEWADGKHRTSGQPRDRVPFLATANDMSSLPAAICRSRRMLTVQFVPSRQDVLTIAGHICKGVLTPSQFEWLSGQSEGLLPADFAQLVSHIEDYAIEAAYVNATAEESLHHALRGDDEPCLESFVVTQDVLEAALEMTRDSIAAAQVGF